MALPQLLIHWGAVPDGLLRPLIYQLELRFRHLIEVAVDAPLERHDVPVRASSASAARVRVVGALIAEPRHLAWQRADKLNTLQRPEMPSESGFRSVELPLQSLLATHERGPGFFRKSVRIISQ